MQTQIQNKNYCAIYCRLSQEDERTGTSGSILNQKEFLRDYVLNNGWIIYDVYVDDGVSGTTFERPGFQAMISDIEKGKINTVLTKDLSRLGRNYLKAGYYTEEYFPEHNIRYIAVNDNVDTHKENTTELTPFKNIMNEWTAKDISKKVRFSLDNQMKSLVQIKTSISVYGYMFNELNERVHDPNTAPIVQYIFKRFIECRCATTIANELKNKQIPIPGYYSYIQTNYNQEYYQTFTEAQKYEWTRNKIYRILKKEEYLGVYIRGKSETKFKGKKKLKTSEEQYKKENAFEPLITKEIFNQVNDIKSNHGTKKSNNLFQGIVYCNECKIKLRIASYKGDISRIYCRNPLSDKDGSIKYNDLVHIVSSDINKIKKVILENEDEFIDYAINYKSTNLNSNNYLNDIETYKLKSTEIEKKVTLLLESYINKDIEKSLYESLLSKYNKEKKEIDIKINELQSKISNKEKPVDYIHQAKLLLEDLKNYEELNEQCIRQFISRIYISRDPKDTNVRKTHVEIEYYKCNDLIKEYLNDSSIIS